MQSWTYLRRTKVIVPMGILAFIALVVWGWHLRTHFHLLEPIGTWIDVLLGTALLAIIPFALAAYGGHIAAETLGDPRRRRAVKAKFWSLCVAGIVLAFLQQYRSITADETGRAKTEKVGQRIVDLLENLHSSGSTGRMSEAERRSQILAVLQQKYVITHEVDQNMIDGLEAPPNDWVNDQLRQLGEKWTVSPPPPSRPVVASGPALAPEQKRAAFAFSFWNGPITKDNVLTTQEVTPKNDEFEISIGAANIGEARAEDLQIWIRCNGCTWEGNAPTGFDLPDADVPYDRSISVPDFPQNVSSQKWSFHLKRQLFPKSNAVRIGCYYTCKNCPQVDWSKPQFLLVTESNIVKPTFPSPPYLPGRPLR